MPRQGTEPKNNDLQGQSFTIKLSKAENRSASFHLDNLLGRHIQTIMKTAQQNKPQEAETLLNNGRKITVINFPRINLIGNAINYIEIPFYN